MNKYLKKCLIEFAVVMGCGYIIYLLFMGAPSLDNQFSVAFIGGGLTMFIVNLIESPATKKVEDKQ